MFYKAIYESIFDENKLIVNPITDPKFKLEFKLPEDSIVAGGYVINKKFKLDRTDIDIFLYGEKNYNKRLKEFISQFDYSEIRIVRTSNYININYCMGDIQIILTKNKDIMDIFNKFDLYASQIGLDENNIYMTNRSKIALEYRINIVDKNAFNKSYIYRLKKYQDEKNIIMIGPNGILQENLSYNPKCYSIYGYPRNTDFDRYNNYCSTTSHNCYKINLKYLMGKSDLFYYDDNGLNIGCWTDYNTSIISFLNGKKSILSLLGNDINEIKSKFNELKELKVYPPIVFKTQIGRYKEVKCEEKDIYLYYEPIWSREVHKHEPIKYIYISKALDFLGEPKELIMLYHSLISLKQRY